MTLRKCNGKAYKETALKQSLWGKKKRRNKKRKRMKETNSGCNETPHHSL